MPECKNQWKLDVNDRYVRAVGIVTSLSSASLVLPILFLKDIAQISSVISFSSSLNAWAYSGWSFLSASILSAIVYYYSSAKWVKLAWEKDTDMFGRKVSVTFVEHMLDGSYFLMMSGFLAGLAAMTIFMLTFTTN